MAFFRVNVCEIYSWAIRLLTVLEHLRAFFVIVYVSKQYQTEI